MPCCWLRECGGSCASMTRMPSFAVLIRLRYFSSELRICLSTAEDRPIPMNSSTPLARRVARDEHAIDPAGSLPQRRGEFVLERSDAGIDGGHTDR